MAFTVVIMAGAFQILFGALKLGKYITLMPYSVISGFMSGIGIILILLQLPPLLGQPTQPGGAMGTISARDALEVVHLAENVAAIGLLAAVQACEIRRQTGGSLRKRSDAVISAVRSVVPPTIQDRRHDNDIVALLELIANGGLPQGA